jgi:hypothetical protein
MRVTDANQAYNAFTWLNKQATAEWVKLFVTDLFRLMRSKGQIGVLAVLMKKDPNLDKFIQDLRKDYLLTSLQK